LQRDKQSALLVAVRLNRSAIIAYLLQQENFDLSRESEAWKLAISNPQIATQILSFYVPSVAKLENRERRFLEKFIRPWQLRRALDGKCQNRQIRI